MNIELKDRMKDMFEVANNIKQFSNENIMNLFTSVANISILR